MLAGALLWTGCATARSAQTSVGDWIDRTRASAAAEGEPRVSFAAEDHVRVHTEPDATSAVKGELTLHEKIRRYQSDGGFAFVETRGELWGWVRESQLALRIPQSSPQAAEPAPAEVQPADGKATPGQGDAAADGENAEAEAPSPDAKQPEREPSVFDPY
jgi:hypothetical protein